MGTTHRGTPLTLENILYQSSSQFEFHAAMKLISTMHFDARASGHNATRFFDEKVLIKVHPTFAMPSKDIYKIIKPSTADSMPEMFINFLGIETRQGPLPDPYIEQLIRSYENNDKAFHAFLSIFNNSIAHLFHDIRKKFWVGISIAPPEETPYGKVLKSLIGIGNQHLENRLKVPDRSLLYYASFFWQKPRSAKALEKLLSHFFKTRFSLKQIIGKWHSIPATQRSSLGRRGQFQKLGTSAVIGSRFWDQQSYFRLTTDPLDLTTFINFLKPGPRYQELISLTDFFVSKQQEFQINLVLKKEHVPQTKLGRGAALSWTTWLKSKAFTKDADQVMLNNNPHFRPVFEKPITLS